MPDQFIKHSSNIIDLIEVGDYVNGERIIEISIDEYGNKKIYYLAPDMYGDEIKLIKDIKSIVTKQCFERMEYKVC